MPARSKKGIGLEVARFADYLLYHHIEDGARVRRLYDHSGVRPPVRASDSDNVFVRGDQAHIDCYRGGFNDHFIPWLNSLSVWARAR